MRPQCGVAGGARATEEEGEPVGGEQNAAAEAAGTAAGAGAGAVPGSRLLYHRILHCSRCTAHYNPALLEWRGTYVCASTRARSLAAARLRANEHCSDSRLMPVPFHFSHFRPVLGEVW